MNKKGFTLIELLVVIGILSILAAIAISGFSVYRGRGYDADVKSAIRSMTLAQEAYFVDTDSYADGGGTSQIFLDRGFRLGPNITITTTDNTTFFTVDSNATKGCSVGTGVWNYNSNTGAITGTKCQ